MSAPKTESDQFVVTIDEPDRPDPQTLLAAYMLRDGYSGDEVQAYLDWAVALRTPSGGAA